jgi:rhodanese-related sulfurtransferase
MGSQGVEFSSKQWNAETGVDDVDPKELFAKRSEVVVVDVRRPDEFTGELGHVPGAELIVLDTLPQRLGEIPRDKAVVFVCTMGGRSARAAAFARAQGFDKVYSLKGGMRLWNELQLPTEGRSEI